MFLVLFLHENQLFFEWNSFDYELERDAHHIRINRPKIFHHINIISWIWCVLFRFTQVKSRLSTFKSPSKMIVCHRSKASNAFMVKFDSSKTNCPLTKIKWWKRSPSFHCALFGWSFTFHEIDYRTEIHREEEKNDDFSLWTLKRKKAHEKRIHVQFQFTLYLSLSCCPQCKNVESNQTN